MKFKVSQYAKRYGVSTRTVWNWMYDGKVKFEREPDGKHIRIIEDEDKKLTDAVAIYARVSSSENKDNLERQRERLENYCAARGYKVLKTVTEVGSGLNDKRPKLEKLLTDESVKMIVVEHSDRLARFGLNYIKKLLELQGRKIEVINEQSNDRDDLMQDFVSIITSFCARLYGMRRNKRRTELIIKELERQSETDRETYDKEGA